MNYEYEIYIEPENQHTIEAIESILQKFNIVENAGRRLTLLFGGWKLWINFSEGEEITDEAYDLARYHDKPKIAKSTTRLEISTEDDEDELHYNDHLYVVEALSELEGAHVYDRLLDEFLYGEAPAERSIPDLRLEFLDELEDDPQYADLALELRSNSYNVSVWEELEEAMEEDGNITLQLNCLHNLLTLCPWDYVPWFNSGIVYRDLGKYSQAEGYFRKVTELEPGFSDAWADLGKLYFRKGKTKEGLEYIDKAIAAKSDNDIPYVNAGYYLVKLGNPQKALEYSEAGIQYDKYCCTFNKAHALLALGRQDEAVEFYRKSLKAADSKQAFKTDFKADFVILKKYDLSKAEYEALLPLILN